MPAFESTLLRDTLVTRASSLTAANATHEVLQVVCSWPVSAQYGPGTRLLYYVLVAACVVARKIDWMRNACLAAALLFPAVAAIHGIALAAYHVDDAVDMDIYGAFQLCTIGILAAPVTVRLSRTYFDDPGRNTIFLWIGLVLAGLASLTVEFYRTNSEPCPFDDSGKPLSKDPTAFPYDNPPTCGRICDPNRGPFSSMRGGAANNIYIVPAPTYLTFGTATLIAAACCLPAILSMVSMWNKILEINWKRRYRNTVEEPDELISGTNGATIGNMRRVNDRIRYFLSVVEIPVFGGAVLALLIIGEINFFSKQVINQMEPMASVGQWAPLAGTGLAVLGSFYLLLAADVEAVERGRGPVVVHRCDCPHYQRSPGSDGTQSLHESDSTTPPHRASISPQMQEIGTDIMSAPPRRSFASVAASDDQPSPHADLEPATTRTTTINAGELQRKTTVDVGSRRKVAEGIAKVGKWFGNAAGDWLDDSEFRKGKASDFPEIPGESQRNEALNRIKENYSQLHTLREQRSRAGSFISVASGATTPGSPSQAAGTSHRPVSNTTWPAERTTSEPYHPASSSAASRGENQPPRRNTLGVPSTTRHGSMRHTPPAILINSLSDNTDSQGTPTIVVSTERDSPRNSTPLSKSPPASPPGEASHPR